MLTRRHVLAALSVLPPVAAAQACTQIQMFDTVMPGYRGVRQVARDVPFGSGPRQRLDIYAPTGTPPVGGWPVVIFYYGGSWRSGRRQDYHFAATAIASLGAVCVVPDYRLVPDVVFPAFVEDGAAALAWTGANVAGRAAGDPRRIVLAGHSAGAHIASLVALAPATRGQIAGWIGLAGPYDFLPLDVEATRAAFGHLAPGPALDASQPVRQPAERSAPALLIHGRQDTTVRPRQSEAMARHLEAAGVPVTLRMITSAGHITVLTALARPLRGVAPVREAIAAFLSGLPPRG
jgi:acetyl esterase/lipase